MVPLMRLRPSDREPSLFGTAEQGARILLAGIISSGQGIMYLEENTRIQSC